MFSHGSGVLGVSYLEFIPEEGTLSPSESVDFVVSLTEGFSVLSEHGFLDSQAFFHFHVVVAGVMLLPGAVLSDEEVSASFVRSAELVGGSLIVSPDGELAHFVGHDSLQVFTAASFQVPVSSISISSDTVTEFGVEAL